MPAFPREKKIVSFAWEWQRTDPAMLQELQPQIYAAGLDGIEKHMTPPEEISENIFAMTAAERRANGIENLPITSTTPLKSAKNASPTPVSTPRTT